MARVNTEEVVSTIVWAGKGRKCCLMPVLRPVAGLAPIAETDDERTALCPRTKLIPAWMTTPSSLAANGAGGGVDRRLLDRLAETDCDRDSL